MLASRYHFIGNGEFWLPFWPSFNSQGLENDIRMGNGSGYKAILKNKP